MLLNKTIEILVYKITSDGTFEPLGEIEQYASLIWPDKYNGFAQFELWAPITNVNSTLLKKGNILWCGGDNAARIEIVKSISDDEGNMTFNVKGRTLEMLLTTRIIWGTYNASNKRASTVMYDIVNQNCVNPTNPKRKIPFLECAADLNLGEVMTIQRTGGEVYTMLENIAKANDLGFDVVFKPKENKMVFTVNAGVDRTVEQTENEPIDLGTDLEDLLTSTYYSNDQDEKGVALVMGEDSAEQRASVISGDDNLELFERRELFVDARDLQSETHDEGNTEVVLTPAEYAAVLMQRGEEKLAECMTIESFEAQVRIFGEVQYQFGVDYKKGDKITMRDKRLGVIISARITEVEEIFDSKYSVLLTFGYQYPTLIQKVTKQ